MSWQEDLQELDSALAAGRISADDYRRRRDELLTAAAGQPAAPQQPQQQQGPFPPPFKWGPGPAQPQQDNPDRTQVVSPQQQQPPQQPQQPAQDSDRTQFVRPVTGPQPQQQMPGPADRTQVVPGPNSGGFPAQSWDQGGGWGQQDVISPPPWGAGASGVDAWGQKQGPEVFDDESKGGKGKIILIVLIVLLVAGLGVGAYFLWGRGGGGGPTDQTTAQQQSTTQAPTTTTKPKTVPEGPFVEVPGKVSQFKTLSIEEALAAKVPTLEEAQILQGAGVSEVRFAVSTDDAAGLSQGIWAFKAGTPATALDKIDALYQAASFELVPTAPTGVKVRHLPLTAANKVATYRAHYINGDFVVRVEAYGADEATVKAAFDTLLERQLAEHPAK
ncbi:hypothetical protein Lesp02_48160 [Lentzea sp. NBRC 105346]|uniref:hypothetical protein n=1 Tax=Lentzea sp. NBRC 105346 TaxID=3032205 RepID=UPI0024A2E470|nr:hypothetical protein [Lentzea sp. NBRC 105346]GLZ32628.1 hypothetical protein Lesp02_48160 [Lentzea sp. NBRC 105346]